MLPGSGDDTLPPRVQGLIDQLADTGYGDQKSLVSAALSLDGGIKITMKVSKAMLKAGMNDSRKFRRWVATRLAADVRIVDIEEPGEGDLANNEYEYTQIVDSMPDSIQDAGAMALAKGITAGYLAVRTEQRRAVAALRV